MEVDGEIRRRRVVARRDNTAEGAPGREVLFDLGAEAFALTFPGVVARALPADVAMYVCPLCLHAYPKEAISNGVFTIEHAPPKSLDGKPLVLTCLKCNRHSGKSLDPHMMKADRPIAVLRGEHPGGQLVRVRVGDGPPINVRLRRNEGGYLLEGKDGVDVPADRAAFLATLSRIAASGSTDWDFHLDFRDDRHCPKRARAGWLRVGLLVTFAAFGYRYAFGPALSIVRQQIWEPENELIPPSFHVIDPNAPRTTRHIGIVNEPSELKGIAVQVGWHLVLLPHPTDTGFYVRLRDFASKAGARFEGQMSEVEWPKTPMHAADVQANGSI